MMKTKEKAGSLVPDPRKEDETLGKTAQFVCRDIVRKKKNPQQKMERYFVVTKPKCQKVEKNFQGFPLSQCQYEEEVDEYVYCPPCYPSSVEEEETFVGGRKKKKKKKQERRLCKECFLRPCIVKGKWNDIMGFCEDIMVFENDDSDGMYFKMINHVQSILVEVFGSRYARNHGVPACVNAIVGNYLTIKSEMEGEDGEDPDDELVGRSVDGTDFLTQSWQQH